MVTRTQDNLMLHVLGIIIVLWMYWENLEENFCGQNVNHENRFTIVYYS